MKCSQDHCEIEFTQFDHEHAVPFLLVRREDDDACEVVVVVGDLFFGEEAENVVPLGVCIC